MRVDMKDKLMIFGKEYSLKETVSILLLIMVIGGIIGFIYEEIFYRIDLGYFIKRGSTFGPWIPIYAYGSLLITILTYRFRGEPLKVFTINTLLTGTLEYVTGFLLYKFKRIRLWDYNNEILNFGNINGYICARSVLLFGFSSLALIYLIIPKLLKITKNVDENKLLYLSIILGSMFFLDEMLYIILK